MVKLLHKKHVQPVFIALSSLSIGGLFASFGYPLQTMEIWKQRESNGLAKSHDRIFILTDSDLQKPYGFNPDKARKAAQIYRDFKAQKFLLLGLSLLSGAFALRLSSEAVEGEEIDTAARTLNRKAQKEQLLSQMRHKWAMLSEAQRQQFQEEYQALADLSKGETAVPDIGLSDKCIEASYALESGEPIDAVVARIWNVAEGTPQHAYIQEQFEMWREE